jgi:homogentisate 1,2-dioxygenase
VLERLAFGEQPRKHHLVLRSASGTLRYEQCLTRRGFDGPYTISYHEHRPQALRAIGAPVLEPLSPMTKRTERPLASGSRRHFRTLSLGSQPREAALLFNQDLVLGCFRPATSDTSYRINAGADALCFVLSGRGMLRSTLGDLEFAPGDYVFVPKGLLHRYVLEHSELHLLTLEFPAGVAIPARFRNPAGQLRMDAPYCHRDFQRPRFRGPLDEGLREVVVKRGPERQTFAYAHNPLDVVGWDGCVYPWAFPILNFQPRVSSVHLPPTWHGTFEAPGALICSFVPRPLDFHPEAVPCPYAHTSADVDEVLFYVEGDFASRTGVERGSLTLHPGGIPHGPHPGRYESSIGAQRTEEVAVMLDCNARLHATSIALSIEDESYENSFEDAAPTRAIERPRPG